MRSYSKTILHACLPQIYVIGNELLFRLGHQKTLHRANRQKFWVCLQVWNTKLQEVLIGNFF